MILKFKIFIFCLFCSTNLFSINILVAKNKIQYKAYIKKNDLVLKKVSNIPKDCTPFNINKLDENKYIAKHYIQRGALICTKNVKKYKKKSVIFNFGNIQIERNAKVVFENDTYITIKKRDGKLEKIYKNGINK